MKVIFFTSSKSKLPKILHKIKHLCIIKSMYTEIKNEICNWEKSFFSGKIKFGIENGNIVTLNVVTCSDFNADTEIDYLDFLKNTLINNYYGFVEFYMCKGKIFRAEWGKTLKGEELKNRINKNLCKNVRIVIKK